MCRRSHVPLILVAVVLACRGAESGRSDSARAGVAPRPDFHATFAGETDGMRDPESVRYDPELDRYYVSNMVGNPSVKDRQGFIAVVRADTVSRMQRLVESGRHGAVLNAPKGMGIIGDTIWVADIDVVRGFDRRSGDPVGTIDLSAQGATLLNDVAVGPNGALYITDTGVRYDASGSSTHAGKNRIFKIADRHVTELASGDAFASPNGITWDGDLGVWLLAPLGSKDVQTWREGDSLPKPLVTGPGAYDGIELTDDGRIYVSSWADSAVHVIYQGVMTRLVTGVPSPADIGFDSNRDIIAIPLSTEGKVVYYHAP